MTCGSIDELMLSGRSDPGGSGCGTAHLLASMKVVTWFERTTVYAQEFYVASNRPRFVASLVRLWPKNTTPWHMTRLSNVFFIVAHSIIV